MLVYICEVYCLTKSMFLFSNIYLAGSKESCVDYFFSQIYLYLCIKETRIDNGPQFLEFDIKIKFGDQLI